MGGKSINFFEVGFIRGEKIQFKEKPELEAEIYSDQQVRFNNRLWKLSPLVRYIKEKYNLNPHPSGVYAGLDFFMYKDHVLRKFQGRQLKDVIYDNKRGNPEILNKDAIGNVLSERFLKKISKSSDAKKRLKSLEYINLISELTLKNISIHLDELQKLCKRDFGSINRKIGKFLLYLKFPESKDIITENPNSIDFNIFEMAEVAKKIIETGNENIFKNSKNYENDKLIGDLKSMY